MSGPGLRRPAGSSPPPGGGAGRARVLLPWLRRILGRNFTDQLKLHRRQARDLKRELPLRRLLADARPAALAALSAPGPSPSGILETKERSESLSRALASLGGAQREVIELHWAQRLPFKEVSCLLGRSAGAARMLWRRALGRLRRLLER